MELSNVLFKNFKRSCLYLAQFAFGEQCFMLLKATPVISKFQFFPDNCATPEKRAKSGGAVGNFHNQCTGSNPNTLSTANIPPANSSSLEKKGEVKKNMLILPLLFVIQSLSNKNYAYTIMNSIAVISLLIHVQVVIFTTQDACLCLVLYILGNKGLVQPINSTCILFVRTKGSEGFKLTSSFHTSRMIL